MKKVSNLILMGLLSLTAGCASKGISTKPNTPATLAVDDLYYESEVKYGRSAKDYEKNLTRTHQFMGGAPFAKDNIQLQLETPVTIKLKDYSAFQTEQRKLGKPDTETKAAIESMIKKELAEKTEGKTCFDFDYIASGPDGIRDGGNSDYWGVKVFNAGKEVPAKLEIAKYGISMNTVSTSTSGYSSKSTDWTQYSGSICTAKALDLKAGIAVELHPRFLKNVPVKKFEWLVKAPTPTQK